MTTESPGTYWWTWAAAGLVTLGVGVLVLAQPGKSLKALAVIAGIYFLLDSVMAFVPALRPESAAGQHAVLHGIVSLVIGILLVRHPLESITAIALLIGIWLLAIGSVRLVAAFHEREHLVWRAFVGAAAMVAGIVIIANPQISYGTLALIAGISLILQGLGMVVLGWSLRGVEREHGAPTSPYAGPAPS